jgi:uncharacterized protein HemY
MKKILIFLWIIITSGLIFISYHYIGGTDKAEAPVYVESENETSEQEEENKPETQVLEKPLTGSIDELIKTGQIEEASQKLSLEDSDDEKNQLLKARILLAKNEIEAANNILTSLDEENSENKLYQAIIFILYKEFDIAQDLLEEIEKQAAENSVVRAKALRILDAFNTFSYYLEADPSFLEALIAKSFANIQEYHAAIALSFEVLGEHNNYRDTWVILGYSNLQLQKFNDAIDALEKARDLDPEKGVTNFYLGLSYLKSGKIEESKYYLREAKRLGYELPEEYL